MHTLIVLLLADIPSGPPRPLSKQDAVALASGREPHPSLDGGGSTDYCPCTIDDNKDPSMTHTILSERIMVEEHEDLLHPFRIKRGGTVRPNYAARTSSRKTAGKSRTI